MGIKIDSTMCCALLVTTLVLSLTRSQVAGNLACPAHVLSEDFFVGFASPVFSDDLTFVHDEYAVC
jgi:hypothetical protein